MQWTTEQLAVIESCSPIVKVLAFAGTGKTSTLIGYSQARPESRLLYICYNKSIEVEAKTRFPRNVVCKTAHGLAYAAIGVQYQGKLTNNLRLTDIARAANTQNWELAKDITGTLNNFMCSDDQAISDVHFPRFRDLKHLTSKHQHQINSAVRFAQTYWARMIDVNDSSASITHDGYLKVFALTKPDLSRKFAGVMADEAQDANPVIAGLLRTQVEHGCQLTVCGDQHQQLYRFRGAEDILNASWLNGAQVLRLTESFRFGFGVAHVANMLLSVKGETVPLQGMGPKTQIKKTLPADLPHRTFLHRTVFGVIENALAMLEQGHRLYWVGGINSYSLRDLEDLYAFKVGKTHEIEGRQLVRDYVDFAEYREIAEETQDPEMMRSIKILDQYKEKLPELIAKLRKSSVTDELEATVTLATAHRSKGLEWDFVSLYEDFSFDPLDPDNKDPKQRDDELNLLYVACTRAKSILAVNAIVLTIMEHCVDARKKAEAKHAASC